MGSLYCVALMGPDNIYAVESKIEAYTIANEMNEYLTKMANEKKFDDLWPIVWARPAMWHLGEESHAKQMKKIGPDWKKWDV